MPASRRRSARSAGANDVAWRLLVVLTTARAQNLLFSLPYLLVWTRGLDLLGRVGLVGAHACAMLVFGTRSDAVDAARGLAPRLGLTRQARWTAVPLSRASAPLLTAAALLGGVAAGRIHGLAPVGVAALVGAAWLAAHVPTRWKYLVAPELGLPLLLLVAPATALAWLADASVPWLSVASSAAALGAVVLACHLRDRDRDLADDVPTLATRRPRAATGWLWTAVVVAALAMLAPLEHPLDALERLALLGGLGLAAAVPLGRARVPALVVVHALLALTWLLR